MLTSDLCCYSKENRDKDILPSIDQFPNSTGMLDGYHYVKERSNERAATRNFRPRPPKFSAHKPVAGILRITSLPALFVSDPAISVRVRGKTGELSGSNFDYPLRVRQTLPVGFNSAAVCLGDSVSHG